MTQKITILCRIIDNLGDAGVTLRLARQWLTQRPNDVIDIYTDHLKPFLALIGCSNNTSKSIKKFDLFKNCQVTQSIEPNLLDEWGSIVIEMFGSPISPHWKQTLALYQPQTKWVNLEYLSAEAWVEDFHGRYSPDPITGWQQLFFFPGFSDKTGGLLGLESNSNSNLVGRILRPNNNGLNFFVFAYDLDPLKKWLNHFKTKPNTKPITFHLASHDRPNTIYHPSIKKVPFVKQIEFDTLLSFYDYLLVRGEDSFVRAQLSGKPFVWQIYPTEDGAHWHKLDAFFTRYAANLPEPVRSLWQQVWYFWNGKADVHANCLEQALVHHETLITHALLWKQQILPQCALIQRLHQSLNLR
jgi:uncharacterized repeat protein (TIGR03837 family)